MGNPYRSYCKMMQQLIRIYNENYDSKIEIDMKTNNLTEVLENVIKKAITNDELTKRRMLYCGGISFESVIHDIVKNHGCDELNAAVAGTAMFEKLLGVEEEDENEEGESPYTDLDRKFATITFKDGEISKAEIVGENENGYVLEHSLGNPVVFVEKSKIKKIDYS